MSNQIIQDNWIKDKKTTKTFPYMVVGDGFILKKNIIKSLALWGITRKPVPWYCYASNLEEAEAIADKTRTNGYNTTVYICKLVTVYINEEEDK